MRRFKYDDMLDFEEEQIPLDPLLFSYPRHLDLDYLNEHELTHFNSALVLQYLSGVSDKQVLSVGDIQNVVAPAIVEVTPKPIVPLT